MALGEPVVRAAGETDAEAMAAVYVASARAAWPHIFGAANLQRLEPPVERFRSEIVADDPRHQVLVAESGERVVAFAIVRPSEDDDADPTVVGELDTFYSDPEVWGHGVGRALHERVVEALRHGGFQEATLWTAEQNHRPRRIYGVAGWEPDGAGRERTWCGVSFRELRYRLQLPG
jgi:GNAT superfamily N-acetyltransferase